MCSNRSPALPPRIATKLAVHDVIPLDLLNAGETGSVTEVSGQESFVSRLGEMGLRAGAEVRMLQPGQPCIIALDNHRLSFRGEDAAHVLVEVRRENR